MITLSNVNNFNRTLSFFGLSSDTKPTGIFVQDEVSRYSVTNGSVFVEIDTGDEYMFDDVSDTWVKIDGGGGGVKREIVNTLPTTNIDPDTIYLIADSDGSGDNTYIEYMYVNDAWEALGSYIPDIWGRGTGTNSAVLKGDNNTATGTSAVAIGQYSSATNTASFAEGFTTRATGPGAHSEGENSTASGYVSHAEGFYTSADQTAAHAEGMNTQANGQGSHAEGNETTASGKFAHSEGLSTTASAMAAHAEGDGASATQTGAHAEGRVTTASGEASHAEGAGSKAYGVGAHAEGGGTIASGGSSHAEGGGTTASGEYSHAEGGQTIANHKSQHVFGEWNIEDDSSALGTERGNYIEIVGNGEIPDGGSTAVRSNARTLDWSGNEWLAGNVSVEDVMLPLEDGSNTRTSLLDKLDSFDTDVTNLSEDITNLSTNITNVVAQQVEQMQIHEGQTVIDSTLTVQGAAADAKKTGDELANLSSAVEQIDNVLTVASSDVSLWESGGINLPDGQDYETNTRIRTDYISRDIAIVNPSNGYQIGIYVYDSSDAYLGMYNGTDYSTTVPYWYSLNADLTEIPSGYNIRLLARKESNESIAPSDATNVLFGSYLDTSLTMSGKAADAKAVGDRLTALEEEIEDIEPLSNEIKEALLECFEHVVWTDHDEDYYQALRDALYASDLVVSINAVFTQGSTVIYPDESLDNLRSILVVTGLYEDSSTRTITGYTLSGTLVGGTTSTITVSYQGKTTTFNVVVTDYEWGSDYTWLYRADTDGLLSANENVSEVVGINGTLGTEALSDGVLNVSAPYNSTNYGNIYKLIPITGNGVLKAKVRFNALAKSLSPSGFRLQVSNGTDGAQIFAYKNADANTYRISTHQGGTQYLLADNINLDRWYILSCELQGNKQVLKVDNSTYTINSLSSYANTQTRVIVQQPGALSGYSDIGDVDVDIAWVSFKDNSAQ